jgi:hypothetical protein
MKAGDKVRWHWGQGTAEGTVKTTYDETVTRKLKGHEITRHGSRTTPRSLSSRTTATACSSSPPRWNGRDGDPGRGRRGGARRARGPARRPRLRDRRHARHPAAQARPGLPLRGPRRHDHRARPRARAAGAPGRAAGLRAGLDVPPAPRPPPGHGRGRPRAQAVPLPPGVVGPPLGHQVLPAPRLRPRAPRHPRPRGARPQGPPGRPPLRARRRRDAHRPAVLARGPRGVRPGQRLLRRAHPAQQPRAPARRAHRARLQGEVRKPRAPLAPGPHAPARAGEGPGPARGGAADWTDEAGLPHALTSTALNAYLDEADGDPGLAFTAKTFRTWAGTLAAYQRLEEGDGPSLKALSEAAAERLHNTPAVARASYVHPAVLDLAGSAPPPVPAEPVPGLSPPEARLLALLDAFT